MAAAKPLTLLRRWSGLLGLVILAAASGCRPAVDADGVAALPVERLTVNGRPLTAELALNDADRLRGLTGRESLAADRGMLFVFRGEARRQFVMRDCLIDIDIAFIDAAGRVANVHRMAREPLGTPEGRLQRYGSDGPVLMALELAAGGLDRYGLKAGVELNLPVRELRRRAE